MSLLRASLAKTLRIALLTATLLVGPQLRANADDSDSGCVSACIATFGLWHWHDEKLHVFTWCSTTGDSSGHIFISCYYTEFAI